MKLWLLLLFLVTFCQSALVEIGSPIEYLSYDEIVQGLHELQQQYPDTVRLYSAQEAFQLSSVGHCGVKQEPCTIWIVELVNRTGKTPQQLAQLPEMIVSGELHGDEPIGTLSSFYFIKTLVEQAPHDLWLSMLLKTRILTVIPMTNAVGYAHNVRGESEIGTDYFGIDPNRDFPFDQEPQNCMRTVAAKTLQSLFHRHLFQFLLTFHGGTNVLGYEWGDLVHCHSTMCEPCPDYPMMHSIANQLQQVSGSAGPYEEPYIVGDMGSTVYPVHGGLEDWAYGASWSNTSGYCLWNHSTATNVSNRCIAYLIETSREKRPLESTLGYYDWPIIRNDSSNNRDGHIPRNIRLSLMAMDLLQPFIYLIGWGDKEMITNNNPSSLLLERWYSIMDGTFHRQVKYEKDDFQLVWWVGGGLVVHETWIQFATSEDDSYFLQGQTMKQNSSQWMDPFLYHNNTLSGYWFHDSINWTGLLRAGHVIYLRGLVSMDDANKESQSHWVQARNNESWFASIREGEPHEIRGQRYFVSDYYRMEWKDEDSRLDIRIIDKDQLQWHDNRPTLQSKSVSIWSWLKWVLLGIVLGPGTFPLLGCIGVGCLRLCGIRATMPQVPRMWTSWLSKTRWNRSYYYYPMQSPHQEEEEEG